MFISFAPVVNSVTIAGHNYEINNEDNVVGGRKIMIHEQSLIEIVKE